MNNLFSKLQTHLAPEYFFWAAVLCAFSLLVSPPGNLPVIQGSEAVASVLEQPKVNPYEKIDLSAKAIYVYDAKMNRALFARNATEVLPLASITKIMTAATALSLVPETTYIPISSRAIEEEGDSGFKVGEEWLLRDLLKFTLLESSNDGAVAVSSTVGATLATGETTVEEDRSLFIQKMNEHARELNLASTQFFNESGLDLDETRPGAVSTAEETARLLAYALETYPSIFGETRWSELKLGTEGGEKFSAQNTNKDTDTLPLLMASKTGYTDLSGGNLVVAFDAGFNYPIVIAVLGSTAEGRFTDVEKLVWATLEFLRQN